MPRRRHGRDLLVQIRACLRWLWLVVPMAAAVGSACALFLWSLDGVTRVRFAHPWLLWLLPLAGLGIGLLYRRWGKRAEGGNNLILDEIHQAGEGVPRRMAPLVLLGTLATHLFGGSAGREGTAVQMGGSIAGGAARLLRLGPAELRVLLMAGVAAGFGGVFGTPIAGAIFALEVLRVGRLEHGALLPCLIAAVTGDWACHAWGVGHTQYAIAPGVEGAFKLDGLLLAKAGIAGVAFGLCAALFTGLTHRIGDGLKRLVPQAPLRPVLGGVAVIVLTFVAGTDAYLGLGVTHPDPETVSIMACFTAAAAIPAWAWAWKILFTAVTVGAGFKGGEVTPLFFIGATLGHTLAGLLGAPTDLFAALGFVAVFAGATNTPLACTLMGLELFGADHAVYFATACWLGYLFSGHSGIYLSQRISAPKHGFASAGAETTLRDLRRRDRDE